MADLHSPPRGGFHAKLREVEPGVYRTGGEAWTAPPARADCRTAG